MTAALNNIKVLDLSRHAPGPYCSMILGDFGADVIKVEQAISPKGKNSEQQTRSEHSKKLIVKEFAPPDSPFEPLNRNKRSIGINLKSEKGRQIFLKLVETVDVVLEGFRPGVTKRLGIDYDRLKEINPSIIYCAITGYGQDGPYKNLPGHDINYISQGGALGFMDHGFIPGNYIGDLAGGGMQAAIGILLAIIARQSTGKGQFVDISMTDGVLALSTLYLSSYFQNNKLPARHDRVSTGASPFYAVYQTKDGKRLSLACSEPLFFVNLCKILKCEDFIPYQYNPEKAPAIKDFFTRTLLTRNRDEWFDLFIQSDIAVGKVLEPDELINDPQLKHRKIIVEMDHPEDGKIRQVGVAIKLSDTPGNIRKFSPVLGENSTDILNQLGYSTDMIDKLNQKGIVSSGS